MSLAMLRSAIPRCKIGEFDIGMYCRRNGVDNSYIDEPYYKDGELAGMRRLLIPLCKSHYEWIHRPEELYNYDYEAWLNLNAQL
jgi:hypothetical protein